MGVASGSQEEKRCIVSGHLIQELRVVPYMMYRSLQPSESVMSEKE